MSSLSVPPFAEVERERDVAEGQATLQRDHAKRAERERERDEARASHGLSCDVKRSDDPTVPRYCLSVEDTKDGLILLAEENRHAIDLTTEQAQWVHFALGRVLMARGVLADAGDVSTLPTEGAVALDGCAASPPMCGGGSCDRCLARAARRSCAETLAAGELLDLLTCAQEHHCPNQPECSAPAEPLPVADWCGVCLLAHDVRALLARHAP